MPRVRLSATIAPATAPPPAVDGTVPAGMLTYGLSADTVRPFPRSPGTPRHHSTTVGDTAALGSCAAALHATAERSSHTTRPPGAPGPGDGRDPAQTPTSRTRDGGTSRAGRMAAPSSGAWRDHEYHRARVPS